VSTGHIVGPGAVTRTLQGKRVDVAGHVFAGLLLLALLFTLAILAVLVGDQLQRGLPILAERGTDVLTSPLSSRPDRAGVAQGIVGTALLAVMVSVLAFPIGILTAVYLE
jgi:phosphate transport system permease protein